MQPYYILGVMDIASNLIKKDGNRNVSKYASIINRFGQIYFDKEINEFGISSGQQFFLLIIKDFPGISQYNLAKVMGYDKGTTAKAVKKLEDRNYIIRETDTEDKRINRLYITNDASEVIKATMSAKEKWHQILTNGLDEHEISEVERCMKIMSDNAYFYVKNESCK